MKVLVDIKQYHPSEKDKGTPISGEEASGEYTRINLSITTSDKAIELDFEDDYHDKGHDKCEGVIMFLQEYYGKASVTRLHGYYSDGPEYLY